MRSRNHGEVFVTGLSEDERQLLKELFSESPWDIPAEELTDEEAKALLDDLEALAKDAPETGAGTYSIVLGRRDIRAAEMLWILTKALVALAIAAAEPTGLGKLGLIKAGWDAVTKLKDTIGTLDDSEVQVCAAIAATGGEHWRARGNKGASTAEIKAWFEARDQYEPQGLRDILAMLVSKGTIKVTTELETGEKYYRIVF